MKEDKTPRLEEKFYDIEWWNKNIESNTGGVNSGDAFELVSEDGDLTIKETSTGKIWHWNIGTNPNDGSLGVICSKAPIED